ncbi:acyl-CoA thioesterase [Polymorphobacter sp.]|uniref:acyl-CoA thioesterase n=1 Tax=Polymorphobacter sp. TaxID=1909290 RepID=UPI003F6FE10D
MSIDTSLDIPALFAFEEMAPDALRLPPTHSPMVRLYGGQVVAQALAACQHSVAPGRFANSCHANFIRAGDPALPLDFEVSRDSDGRSFSSRRVTVRQQGRVVLTMTASFHVPEPGARHQIAMPDVPGPDGLPTQLDILSKVGDRLPARHQAFWLRDGFIEYRPVEPFHVFEPPVTPPRRHIWFRCTRPLPDDRALHQRLLAYASDLHILHTALAPFGRTWADPELQDASLDHAIWFHDEARIDQWLLYVLDSPYAGNARGLGRGLIYTADGRLIASAVQEGLIRFP